MSSRTPVYDAIGGHYQDAKALPSALVERATVLAACGDVVGLEVLDLACGTGFYTRLLRDRGARTQGVDVSAAMVDTARGIEETAPLGIDYHVHDATDLPHLGDFGLITGVWLLNYATDETVLTSMLQSIRRNLAPGGSFVGVTQNPAFDFAGPPSTKYGWTFEPLTDSDFGTQVYATAHTTPPIQFPAVFTRAEVYSRCARAAGLGEFEWFPLVLDQTARDRFGTGFWHDFQANPYLAAFGCRPAGAGQEAR
ncbi:MAG TPA: class I SAM-dependent methyltransferase [Pseudonocardiaceae bacterium]|jgi:SAM-dependent methyltransferase|nr:class I SAM-dependent methyltransferase [Pseudonocardiaceae bacterium]